MSKINAPVLDSPKLSDLNALEREYAPYKERSKDVNQTRTAEKRIKSASISQCMKLEFLHRLCILGYIDGATLYDVATDKAVKQWFDEKLDAAPKDAPARVRSAIDERKFEQRTKDPEGEIQHFIINVIVALDRKNVSDVVTKGEACKKLITQLTGKPKPI